MNFLAFFHFKNAYYMYFARKGAFSAWIKQKPANEEPVFILKSQYTVAQFDVTHSHIQKCIQMLFQCSVVC